MAIETINPATGERLATFDPLGAAQLEEKLTRAATAFRSWSRRPLAERGAVLTRAADILEAEKSRLRPPDDLGDGKAIAAAANRRRRSAPTGAATTPSTPSVPRARGRERGPGRLGG